MATYQFSGVGRIDCCAECPMCRHEPPSPFRHAWYCEVSDKEIDVDTKPNDCPLVLIEE